MGLKDQAVSLVKNAALLPLYDFFGGLSEFWVAVFGTAGIVLAFRGKLDSNFSALIVALQGLLVVHDGLDDWHSRRMRDGNSNSHQDGNRTLPT